MRRSKRLQSQVQAATNETVNLQDKVVTANGPNAGNDKAHDDTFSDVSDAETEDVKNQLHAAIQGGFKFDGHFYHAQTVPSAPNPCLHVTGPGTIGLPLSTRDAKAIIKVAKQAPFGHGTKTVVDKKVRNTWELDPNQLEFKNPGWASYVKSTITSIVCKALGVVNTLSHPRIELYKLLVYETGSHFLPHQDTEKANGMFATVIVLLPSRYEGGQVHVSSGFDTQVIDMASSSLLETSLLAWYTDVKHEVKPVTSGYRLALAYNLIHTSTSNPPPRLPSVDQEVLRLRHVLRKWSKSTLKNRLHAEDFIAYLLKHQYNNLNLRAGVTLLKGQDAHLIAHLRAAVKDSGILIFLGALTYSLLGEADDNPHRLRQYGPDHQVKFHTIEERNLFLKHVVDLEGNLVTDPQEWRLEDDNLVPKNPFKNLPPDEREYEGYLGNGGGTLQHWYRRTVIMLVHKRNVDTVFLRAAGFKYALSKLQHPNSNTLSREDQATIVAMIHNLEPTPYEDREGDPWITQALKWKSVEMLKEVLLKYHPTVAKFKDDKLSLFLSSFTLQEIFPCFEALLRRTLSVSARVEFLDRIQARLSDNQLAKDWCNKERRQALRKFGTPTTKDVPAFISGAEQLGLAFLATEVSPHLKKLTGTFDFIITLIHSLYDKRAFISYEPGKACTANEWDSFIDDCLNVAVNQWDTAAPSNKASNPSSSEVKLRRLETLFSYCLSLRRIQPCRRLTDYLTSLKDGNLASAYNTFYIPLLPILHRLTSRLKIDITTPPLDEFLRSVIEGYLERILGAPPTGSLLKIRRINCTCQTCSTVNDFILNRNTSQWTGKVYASDRRHLEPLLASIPDLVTSAMHPTKQAVLQITKVQEIVVAQAWKTRAFAAQAFLQTIGDDSVIARLMGGRFEEVQLTLQGRQAFTPGASATDSSVDGTAALAGGATGVHGSGQKRKRVDSTNCVDHGVIDLT